MKRNESRVQPGNLHEAIQLHLEGEDLAELGLAPNPTVLVTFELEPVYA